MKKKALVFSQVLFQIFCFGSLFSQKLPIDTSVYNKWPSISGAAISNDGNYVQYTINNKPVGGTTLIFQDVKKDWKIEVVDSRTAIITKDSRFGVLLKSKDSLGVIELGKTSIQYIPNVKSFRTYQNGDHNILIYQTSIPKNQIVIFNLLSDEKYFIDSVTNYSVNEAGNSLLLERKIIEDNIPMQYLYWFNLKEKKEQMIWSKQYINNDLSQLSNFTLSLDGQQLAFTETPASISSKSIWYFKYGNDKSILLVNEISLSEFKDTKIENIRRFSADGNRIFISLKKRQLSKPKHAMVGLDVWNYLDGKLQAQQLNENSDKNFAAVLNLKDKKIIQLQSENEEFRMAPVNSKSSIDTLGIIYQRNGDGSTSEVGWNQSAQQNISLISLKDAHKYLFHNSKKVSRVSLSPDGNFIVYFSEEQQNFLSYSLSSGATRNISEKIPAPWIELNQRTRIPSPAGISAWFKDNKTVLINDGYDLWKVDLNARISPVNLTNSFGRKNNIIFRLANRNLFPATISETEKLILSAHNEHTGENGFYSKEINESGNPDQLIMGQWEFSIPIQAADKDIWLLSRMNANNFPNYYVTSDFRVFSPVSNLQPQENYHWLTAELHSWRTSSGNQLQGVLYKPEDFNPNNKYPVIFRYYESLANEIHDYKTPKADRGNINIPTFVSNGYLVLALDISFKKQEPGKSALEAIISAARYLNKMPWVDVTKMGIQGSSFGGYETNYIITHTNIFAAAMTEAGVSNVISDYGSLWMDGASKQEYNEAGQMQLGATLWERPDLYIKNSPIFSAHKVVTPLLIMHNKGDGLVAFSQGVEFFTALRRNGKKVWMLQYDDGDHGVNGNSAIDFSIRLLQYFNHYLKDSAAPRWMLYGIPATSKGIDDGLELIKEKDPKTVKWITPKEGGLLTEEERKKAEALKNRKPIMIKLD